MRWKDHRTGESGFLKIFWYFEPGSWKIFCQKKWAIFAGSFV
jgi:hypothetical protein